MKKLLHAHLSRISQISILIILLIQYKSANQSSYNIDYASGRVIYKYEEQTFAILDAGNNIVFEEKVTLLK